MINLPREFSERMSRTLGNNFDKFLKSYDLPPVKGVRINTLKISPEEFKKISPVRLCGKVEWENSGYYAEGESLGKSVFHAAGLYYVQEPSAMCAVPELEVKEGERVLDLCSAPGGKGTQIAQYMHGKGVLVLNEIERSRCNILRSNVERLGVKNALVTCQSPENLANFYTEFFDKILVDAPCSGEGMFKKEEAAVREWSVANVKACAVRQAKILESAHEMLAGGGRLVYSTCTFSEEEDEGQIRSFLTLHPEYKLVKMKKLYPHEVKGEGHFCAVLEKTVGGRREDFCQIKQTKCKEFEDFKKGVISADIKNTVRFGEEVYSVVDGLPSEFRSGVKLGETKNGRFEPSHSLAVSLKNGEFTGLEVDENTALNYLRGLTFDCTVPDGWRIVTYKNYPLGWCKVVKGVAKNHYPKGLRI